MMKDTRKPFIFVGDIHLRTANPRAWKISYLDECMKHLEYIGQLATEVNAECVVLGGDLGHEPDWRMSLLNRVTRLFERYPCPIISAIGNHDVDNRASSTFEESGLWNLANQKIVHVPESGASVRAGCWEFHVFHCDTEECAKLVAGQWPAPVDRDYLHVAVAHAPVGLKATPSIKAIDSVLTPGFHVACFADIHDGWPTRLLKSQTVAINPGILERMSIAEKDQKPAVVVIWPDLKVHLSMMPNALSPKDIFLPAFLSEKEVNSSLGTQFLDKLEEMTVSQDMTDEERIRTVAESMQMGEQVVNMVLTTCTR